MPSTSLIGPLAAFLLILALIPAALWLLKRLPLGKFGAGGSNSGGAGGAVRLVAALPLAPNQRIITVEVGTGEERRWLVLGVTPAGIHTLHTLAPQAEPAAAAPAALPIFAQLLARHQRGPATPPNAGSTDAR
jgi:flagellar protein FliO/FliZ